MQKYLYSGPVMLFDKCIADKWTGETVAVSKRKARSNLTYQLKKILNVNKECKVSLPGKIIEVTEMRG